MRTWVRHAGKPFWVLIGVCVVALLLRLWGIGFGLPHEYHIDEVQYVRQAASMGSEGLEPVWWNNPPFFKYVLLAEYGALFVLGRIMGVYASVADFGARHVADPSLLYLAGRATSAVLGTLTVVVTYLIGKKAYGDRVGLVGAWLLASCFMHVRDSHYATNDVAVTFFVSVAVLSAVLVVQSGRSLWYAVGGIAVGLGFATKYTAALAVVPLVAAHFQAPGVRFRKPRSLRLKKLALVAAAAILAALLASPYFLLRPGEVLSDVYEALYLAGKHGFEGWQIDAAGGYVYYLKSMVWGLGIPVLVAAIGGVLRAAVGRSREDLVLLLLPLLMYGTMGRQKMYFARFLLPLVPSLLVLAAAAVDAALPRSARPGVRLGAQLRLVLVTLLLTAVPLVRSVRLDWLLTRTDTRTLASDWIQTNIRPGASIALDWRTYGPPLPALSDSESGQGYDVLTVGGFGLSDHAVDWYQEQGFDYLVVTSYIADLGLVDEARNRERDAFYAALDRELDVVYEIDPYRGDADSSSVFDEVYGPVTGLWRRERPGPTLKVHRLNVLESEE